MSSLRRSTPYAEHEILRLNPRQLVQACREWHVPIRRGMLDLEVRAALARSVRGRAKVPHKGFVFRPLKPAPDGFAWVSLEALNGLGEVIEGPGFLLPPDQETGMIHTADGWVKVGLVTLGSHSSVAEELKCQLADAALMFLEKSFGKTKPDAETKMVPLPRADACKVRKSLPSQLLACEDEDVLPNRWNGFFKKWCRIRQLKKAARAPTPSDQRRPRRKTTKIKTTKIKTP
mmetsp:Transcript_65689/g.154572  ORF Transcript_65689/g.154572 Transcript_65689/m.154572 type:complete len:232 (-) Transcript_65689:278-973(-)